MIDYDLSKIKAFAFDVDGVLSCNNVMLFEGAQPCRTANIKDGYAMQLAIKQGYDIAIITGGRSQAVRTRYEGLGIKDIFLGASVKIKVFNTWIHEKGLQSDEVIYMGDDIPDFEVMQQCGCPCCPNDAAYEIKQIARYISPVNGGNGCARDIIEQVMRAQGKWMTGTEAFGW